MKVLGLFLVLLAMPQSLFACGPSPQKVEREVLVTADTQAVWALVGDFSRMHQWHPSITHSSVETRQEFVGKPAQYRILKLQDGGKIIEKRRETSVAEMKIGSVIVESTLPISNYSDAITVRAGELKGTSIVAWVGRFNNQANRVQAPIGQDNSAAIEAVAGFYDIGLAHLKKHFEKSSVQ
jgi:hypothetical protein